MESVINKAIGWFKNISEATKELTSGNVSHKSCTIRGMANRSAEYLEKHLYSSSIVRWQTGEPKESGNYIITTKDGVGFFRFCHKEIVDVEFFERFVIAWCKLSDIEPYKEETK